MFTLQGSNIQIIGDTQTTIIGQRMDINPSGGRVSSGKDTEQFMACNADEQKGCEWLGSDDERDSNKSQELESYDDPQSIQKKVNEIRSNYEKMIQDARSVNANWAADNLQRFIDGKGGKVTISPEKIKSFSKVQDGIERIKKNTLDKQLQRQTGNFVLNNNSLYSKDYWIADIKEYSPFSELSYASGASKIYATSTINMSKNGEVFVGNGFIDMRWQDRYDWNNGQSFYIPGYGHIKDNDGIFLKNYGGAKDFDMESNFSLEFDGTYDPKTKKWISIK